MVQITNPLVNTFNHFATFLSETSKGMPEAVKSLGSGLSSMAKNWAPGPQKTFFIKPVSFIGDLLKHYNVDLNRHQTCARLFLWSQSAKVAKSFVNAAETISNFPTLYEAFSKPITKDGDLIRNYVAINRSPAAVPTTTTIGPSSSSSSPSTAVSAEEVVFKKGPRLSHEASLGKRFFGLSAWLISVADAASEFKRYQTHTPFIDKMAPRIYTFVGGFMGLQGLYEEQQFIKTVWGTGVETPRAEKVCSWVNVAANIAYLATSFFNGIKMYSYPNQQLPQWMESALFWSNTATVVLPIAQGVAKKFVADLHEKYKPKEG